MKWMDPAYSSTCLSIPPFGDLMNKSGTLITSALLTFGLAAASMAAGMPTAAAPMAADAPAAGAPSTDAPKTAKKHSKKKKKAAVAPATHKQVYWYSPPTAQRRPGCFLNGPLQRDHLFGPIGRHRPPHSSCAHPHFSHL